MGISEDNLLPISIFPNPNGGNFMISFANESAFEIIDITDAFGKSVKFDFQKLSNAILVDLPGVSTGVYFVTYTLRDHLFFNRVLIQ